MDILTTDLHRICHMISLAADSGGICNIDNAHANFAVVCHRADSTANLGELCRSSYDLPDSTIPVLPSYELRSFLVLRTQAHDKVFEVSMSKWQISERSLDCSMSTAFGEVIIWTTVTTAYR